MNANGNEKHWLKKRFFDTPNPEVLAMTTTYQCNEWLDESDRKLFEEMKVRNPRRYNVAGLANWGIVEGVIYEDWEEKRFELPKFDDDHVFVAGLDFGYTNDPTALFIGVLDKKLKVLYVCDELYEKNLSNKDIYDQIVEMGYAKAHITADSAEPKSIRELAAANSLTEEQCYAKLAEMYDGYHFCEDSVGMYNPFSLLNTFASNKFREYWFETGTPTFLVKVMQQTRYDISTLSDQEVDSSLLSTVNTVFENPVPLLYQSGYLTIRGYDEEFGLYRLGFPNREVKTGFLNFIFQYYLPGEQTSGITLITKITRALRSGKPEDMMLLLESLFARTNYQIQGDAEKDFQYAMYIIFELLGEYVQTEKQTSNGRIDILLQTKDYVYIMEIKTDSSADAALRQIEEKGYARPFVADTRRLFRIGVSFSKETRRIENWKIV